MTTSLSSKASSLAPPSLDAVKAERCRRSLRYFIGEAWPLLEPGREFHTNWHIDAICEHLEAVTAGEIRRLLINVPPRHMKSLAVGVFWPAWDWLRRPDRRYLFASYAERLSKQHSLKCRRLIESQGLLGRDSDATLLERIGYRGLLALLGEDWRLTSDQNEKLRFENDRTGYRIASSVDGFATGEGGDILVADDPHKVKEVESEVQREAVLDWWFGTMATRLNDPQTGAKVIVMQRIHESDLAGAVLERGGYAHLCLPARYEPAHPFVWPDDPRTQPDELIWPNHIPQAELEEIASELGSYRAAGQLQQRPSPAEGGIFKRDWWQLYSQLPETTRLAQSWDLSFKDTDGSDYVVGQLWGAHEAYRCLIAQIRLRADFVATVQAIRALSAYADERFPKLRAHSVWVEDKANGPAVIASLKRELQGIVGVDPRGDKVARAHSVTSVIEAGQVFLPEVVIPAPPGYGQTATETFIDEHAAFPNAAHDDQVDALTQALDRLRSSTKRTVRGGGYDADIYSNR